MTRLYMQVTRLYKSFDQTIECYAVITDSHRTTKTKIYYQRRTATHPKNVSERDRSRIQTTRYHVVINEDMFAAVNRFR